MVTGSQQLTSNDYFKQESAFLKVVHKLAGLHCNINWQLDHIQ